MLDHIIVDSGGVKTPLCRMAVISVLDPKTLSVNPYDPDVIYTLKLICIYCLIFDIFSICIHFT